MPARTRTIASVVSGGAGLEAFPKTRRCSEGNEIPARCKGRLPTFATEGIAGSYSIMILRDCGGESATVVRQACDATLH